jgi:diguanylate cyclase (GGDEF)-like protein/PAS domain S-box-containing protein
MTLPGTGLRVRIAVLILVALVPAFIVVIANAVIERERAITATNDSTKRLARLAAAKEGALIEGARQLTIALSVLPAVTDRDVSACNAYALKLVAAYPQYINFGVAAPDGFVWCSARPMRYPVSVHDRPYFRRAMDGGEAMLSGYQVGRLTGLSSIVFASPIPKPFAASGVAFASLRTSSFGVLGRELGMPHAAVYDIVDHDGLLLSTFPAEKSAEGRDISSYELFRASLGSHYGSLQTAGRDGVTRLYGYAWTGADRSQSVLAVVGVPRELAVAPANRNMLLSLGALAAGALFAILFVSVASRAFLLNPVNRLLEATRRFAAHDLSFRANIDEKSELGELGRAIDHMAASFEQEQQALKKSEARFKDLTDLSSDWYWEQDEHFRFTEMSEPVAHSSGISAASHVGRTRWEIPGVKLSADDWAKHIAVLEAHRAFENFSYERDGPNGEARYFSISGRPVFDRQGAFKGYRGVGKDVTASKVAEARIEYLAYHDGLTTLANRSSFSLILNHDINHAQRQKIGLALLFIDLDGFKAINDTFGHEAGDKLLQVIGRRLKGCVRQNDTVARIGGDEFVALVTNITGPEPAGMIASKILVEIADSYPVSSARIQVTASIGISVFPRDGQDEETLMKNADSAMYRAKQKGKNNFQFYA